MKFRKKPVVIDAVKLEDNCYADMIRLFGEEPGNTYGYVVGTKSPRAENGFMAATNKEGFEMWINTREGTMTGSYGDWIIRGVAGEFYPCKPDIFEQTYEPA